MTSEDLLRLLEPALDGEQMSWLSQSCAYTSERLLAAFVGAGRRLGSDTLQGSASTALAGQAWDMRTAGRVALILSLQERQGEATAAWVQRAYREGDSREKLAVMRALPHLDSGESYVEMALDAGRTNETELFCSIALHNPFPAEHYQPDAFNKLVMKAAFLDLDLGDIVGLEDRADAELARMGMEYIDERLAATRRFPASLWLAIAGSSPPGAVARMIGELHHSVASRRAFAARGLSLSTDTRAITFLEERLSIEPDPKTHEIIGIALSRLQEQSK